MADRRTRCRQGEKRPSTGPFYLDVVEFFMSSDHLHPAYIPEDAVVLEITCRFSFLLIPQTEKIVDIIGIISPILQIRSCSIIAPRHKTPSVVHRV